MNVIVLIVIGFTIGMLIGGEMWNRVSYKGPDSSTIRKNIYILDKDICCRMIPYAVIGPVCEKVNHD